MFSQYLCMGCLIFVVNKEVHVKGGEITDTVKPSLVYPLQPGIWTVKIVYLWEVNIQFSWKT